MSILPFPRPSLVPLKPRGSLRPVGISSGNGQVTMPLSNGEFIALDAEDALRWAVQLYNHAHRLVMASKGDVAGHDPGDSDGGSAA
jgi:hypothetical protein